MRGSKVLLASGLILAIYGAINLIFILMTMIGVHSLNAAYLGFNTGTLFLVVYGLVQGLIPFLAGLAGIFWRENSSRIKLVMVCAWILLISTFGLFFTSYGQPWSTILFDLGFVIVSVIYFHSADQNYQDLK